MNICFLFILIFTMCLCISIQGYDITFSEICTNGGRYALSKEDYARTIVRSSDDKLLVATLSGVFSSADRGASWSLVTHPDFNDNSFYMWIDSGDRVYLGLSNNSTDMVELLILDKDASGNSWTVTDSMEIYAGGLNGLVVEENGASKRIWLSGKKSGQSLNKMAFHSDDMGQTWTEHTVMTTNSESRLLRMWLFRNKPIMFYTSAAEPVMWYKDDQWTELEGATWDPFGNVVETDDGILHLLAGTNNGLVHQTFNGTVWSMGPVVVPRSGMCSDNHWQSPEITTDGIDLFIFYTNSSYKMEYRRYNGGSGTWETAGDVRHQDYVARKYSSACRYYDYVPVAWGRVSQAHVNKDYTKTVTLTKIAVTPSVTMAEPGANDQSGLSVWPNPSGGPLKIVLRTSSVVRRDWRYQVFNANGKLIFSDERGTQNAERSWDGLDNHNNPVTPGTYIITVRNGNNQLLTRKITKQ